MKPTRHQGKSLLYLIVEPDDYDQELDYPLVILLHGFGASMADLATLAPVISRDGYLYAFPQGSLTVEFAPGQVGYSWMPRMPTATLQDAQRAEALLDAFVAEVMEAYRVPPGRVLLMGFSQGGGMTYRWGLRQPELFAGLAALSTTLPNLEVLRPVLPADRSQPIFITHGRSDTVVPVERGRDSKELLEAEGYKPTYIEYSMGHEISPEVMNDLVPWAARVLPPLVRAST